MTQGSGEIQRSPEPLLEAGIVGDVDRFLRCPLERFAKKRDHL